MDWSFTCANISAIRALLGLRFGSTTLSVEFIHINTNISLNPCYNNNASCRVTIDLVRTQVCQSMLTDWVVTSEMSLMLKLDNSLADKPPLIMAQWMIVLMHLLRLHWQCCLYCFYFLLHLVIRKRKPKPIPPWQDNHNKWPTLN